MPKVLIFSGANGSGKTTLANTVVSSSMPYIDADEIRVKEELSDIEASKKALLKIDSCIAKGMDFAFETTMSGLGLMRRFRHLKSKRYTIIIFYLFAYPVELLVERIKERVKKGGHIIKNEDIKRRYYRSAANFWNLYRQYASEWIIINNNEFKYKNVVVGGDDTFHIIENDEFKSFREVLEYGKKKKG